MATEGKIDGYPFSSADLVIDFGIIDGPEFGSDDIVTLSWTEKVEVARAPRMGPKQGPATLGKGSSEATLTLNSDAASRFMKALKQVNKVITAVRFGLVATWTPVGREDVPPRTVEISGARIIGRGESYEGASADAHAMEFPLAIDEVVVDGTALFG